MDAPIKHWPDRCTADPCHCPHVAKCNRNSRNNPAPSPWTNHNNLSINIRDGVCGYFLPMGDNKK